MSRYDFTQLFKAMSKKELGELIHDTLDEMGVDYQSFSKILISGEIRNSENSWYPKFVKTQLRKESAGFELHTQNSWGVESGSTNNAA